jgi:hypothetical protein
MHWQVDLLLRRKEATLPLDTSPFYAKHVSDNPEYYNGNHY